MYPEYKALLIFSRVFELERLEGLVLLLPPRQRQRPATQPKKGFLNNAILTGSEKQRPWRAAKNVLNPQV